jgi:hypothetical protein
VLGPTAAGKSGLSLALAEALGGEVVNADSMQLYRGMDIGTAKLTRPQRRGVRHHLLDVWDVRQAANAADYQGLARAAFADIAGRGGCRCWSVVPVCTSVPLSTILISQERFRVYAIALKPSWPRRAPDLCTIVWPPWIRWLPPRSCPATAAGSSGRSR